MLILPLRLCRFPSEEASRFGIVVTDESNRITEFEEKPAVPRSNLASMVSTFLMAGTQGRPD